MQILLDTHVLLWAAGESHRLGRRARQLIADPVVDGYISDVSVWELAIKLGLGKLTLPVALHPFMVNSYADLGHATPLPIRRLHLLGVEGLPLHHRDPFDRLLISQARHEGMALVSADRRLDAYGVERIWD